MQSYNIEFSILKSLKARWKCSSTQIAKSIRHTLHGAQLFIVEVVARSKRKDTPTSMHKLSIFRMRLSTKVQGLRRRQFAHSM
jgi:hypothetical protein